MTCMTCGEEGVIKIKIYIFSLICSVGIVIILYLPLQMLFFCHYLFSGYEIELSCVALS